jgi:hypothetical protein
VQRLTFCFISETAKPTVGWQLHMR